MATMPDSCYRGLEYISVRCAPMFLSGFLAMFSYPPAHLAVIFMVVCISPPDLGWSCDTQTQASGGCKHHDSETTSACPDISNGRVTRDCLYPVLVNARI